MNIYSSVSGKPNAGKASVTTPFLVGKENEYRIFSVGDALRDERKSGTDFGKKVESYMKSGALVPDDLIINYVFEKTADWDCHIILDGFPRNVDQAIAMVRNGMKLEKFIYLSADNETICNRAADRLTCTNCGHTFTENGNYKKPKVSGICDDCGGKLIHREDDNPKTVQKRLEVFEQQTAPVLDFMKKTGVPVFEIDGTKATAIDYFAKAMLA